MVSWFFVLAPSPRLARAFQVRPGLGRGTRGGLMALESGLPDHSRVVSGPHEEEGVTGVLVRGTLLLLLWGEPGR